MNRTTRYKIAFGLIVLVPVLICIYLAEVFGLPPGFLFLIAILALIPGRVSGYYWREFYSGRKLMSSKLWVEAIEHFEKFLDQIKQRPWLKKLIWLSWGTYTRDIEAMTHNNIGAANMENGKFDKASYHFQIAINLDSESPLPYFNLALLSEIKGEHDTARQFLDKSRHLGFTNNSYDRLVLAAGELLAKLEGRAKI